MGSFTVVAPRTAACDRPRRGRPRAVMILGLPAWIGNSILQTLGGHARARESLMNRQVREGTR